MRRSLSLTPQLSIDQIAGLSVSAIPPQRIPLQHRMPPMPPQIRKTPRPLDQRTDAAEVSTLAYLLQGTGFIGFLVLLFWLAGFRG